MWAICAIYTDGRVAYLRHGAKIGRGAVVLFRRKREAQLHLDLIRPGFDEKETQSLNVVSYRKGLERMAS